jgi:hypothetical protein
MGIGELRGRGRDVPDELLSFIAPRHRHHARHLVHARPVKEVRGRVTNGL